MVHGVDFEEFLHDLCPERVPRAPRAQRKLVTFRVGVAPDEIGHGTFVRDLAEAVDDADLVEGVDARTQPAVYAEYPVVDHDAQRQEIEHVGEVVPYVCVTVFAIAFRVETVGLSHPAGFVVPPDQVDARWVAEFEEDEKSDGLDAEEAAVDVVACSREASQWIRWVAEEDMMGILIDRCRKQRIDVSILGFHRAHGQTKEGSHTEEEVVRVWAKSSYSEYLNHVKELPVNVAHNRNGSGDVDDIALFHQKLFRLGADGLDDCVREQFFLIQSFDAFVQVDAGYRCEKIPR